MKDWELTEESFDLLLNWLDPQHREAAGEKYETIRRRLITLFESRGCAAAEELADETINRVIRRLPAMRETYSGDPIPYFYTVARNLYLEYLRKQANPLPQPDEIMLTKTEADEDEKIFEYLEECLGQLLPQSRELILKYYSENKQAKIDFRKRLADELKMTARALRLRVHRIRTTLEECLTRRLSHPPPETK